ncbi:MAG TPA: polymer-forming cytoskeletal protein [Vicinamibacteria bacterium]
MAANPAATAGVVGEGAVLNGKVKGHDLTVFGVLEGELLLEGRLLVGPNGRVAARVRAKEVQVDGAIEGEVNAASLILGETARARGTFVAKRLVVKEGALVEGSINPGTDAAVEPVPASPAPTSAPPATPDAGEAAPKDGADGPTV